jgi:hypothetical protein
MKRRNELVVLAVVFLCVAGTHIWMIWMAPTALSFSPHHVNTDSAVMPLMGRHMLEKGEFPIFYYGQNWFGSLSAMVHAAVFFVLGGTPPWSVHVAPLLFFLGFCLVLYGLARDALGPAVALAALAWNVVTPVRLSEFTTLPHGGYVEGLTLGTVVLWLAVRLVRAPGRWRKDGYYALLGFAGGLAWWTSPLVVYQVLAGAIYVVMRERAAAVVKGALVSLPAFFLGAAPFFYYYAVDPYSSLSDLGGGYAASQVPAGLYLLFAERLPEYLDWDLFGQAIPFAAVLAALAYGWATLFFLWKLRKSFRADHPLGHAAVFPIFFLVFVLLFAASGHIRRAAPQYALPLSAFFPVALGFWLVRARGSWKLAAWAGCAALFLLHGWTSTSWVVSNAPRAETMTQGLLQLIRGLEARGVKRLYVPVTFGSEILNFYSGERIIASQTTADRYPPNQDVLERDPEPAFLFPRGADNLTRTLEVLGASHSTETIDFQDLVRPVRGPDRRYRQILATSLRASASHETRTMPNVVDRDMDSFWTSNELKRPGMWVELDLGRPLTVGMVRLWNRGEHHGNYAMDVRVETSVDGTVWREVVKRSATDYFYWSGPRVYGWEWGYRWEARFPPVEARFVKITQYEDNQRSPWMIAESYVYEDLGARPPGQPGDQDVLRRIQALGLDRVYADRWMSARIAESSRNGIETVTPFTLAIAAFYVRLKSRVVQWTPRTGFVLEDSDADEFQRLMRDEGIHHLTREDWGPWVLFHLQGPGGSPEAPPGDPGWWWMGLGVVKTGSKAKSGYLASLGQRAYREGDAARALALSRRAVAAYAFNHAARQTLIRALDGLGRKEEALEESRALRELVEPRVRVSAEFDGTLQLLGYTPEGTHARPGQDFRVRYFWKVKRDPGRKETIGVFSHLESGQARFQGDHRFLSGHAKGVWPTLEDEIFSEDAWIGVPADAAPGTYRILLGVYDLPTGRRWKVSASEAPAHRERVPIGVLQVEAAGAR